MLIKCPVYPGVVQRQKRTERIILLPTLKSIQHRETLCKWAIDIIELGPISHLVCIYWGSQLSVTITEYLGQLTKNKKHLFCLEVLEAPKKNVTQQNKAHQEQETSCSIGKARILPLLCLPLLSEPVNMAAGERSPQIVCWVWHLQPSGNPWSSPSRCYYPHGIVTESSKVDFTVLSASHLGWGNIWEAHRCHEFWPISTVCFL